MKKRKLKQMSNDVVKKSMSLTQIKKFVHSLKRGTPIIVEWNDAWSKRGWYNEDEVVRVSTYVSNAGWFINMDGDWLRLAAGRSTSDHMVTDLWGIPLGMITNLRKLM